MTYNICRVVNSDPEGSKTFDQIQIRSISEINISDLDSNLDPKPDLKYICKKGPYIQAKIS